MRYLFYLLLLLPLNGQIVTRPGGGGGGGMAATFRTVTFSATPSFACNSNTSTTFKLTLTADVTSSTFATCNTGQFIKLVLCQDGVGAHTFVGPTNLKNFSTIDATAHYCTIAEGQYDGTNVVITGTTVVMDDYTALSSAYTFSGATSGSATLSVSDVAGAAHTILLPTTAGTVGLVIASGAKALATGAIASATCTTAQTATATGTLTTDTVVFTPNADISGVTGYAPVTTGGLTIIAYPTTDTVNFKNCNWSTASVTPGAVTLNWRVLR